MNQFDILLTAAADGSKGQTDKPYKGEPQTLTKQGMRHPVCPSDTCCTTISISVITILCPGGRSN